MSLSLHRADCPHCEELRERVAWLESELGLQREADILVKIRAALPAGITSKPQVAQTIAALYAAKGRPMTRFQLLEAVPPKWDNENRCENIVSVWVSHARKALEFESIGTVWGRGFYLTPIGMAKVAGIIAPSKGLAA